jgi:high-affinity Fe2+/Pb2+ permease
MPEDSKVGWGLIGGGLFGAVLGVILIVVGANSNPKNIILIVAAAFFLLLMAYLIGYGIKKLVSAGSSA